MLERNMGMSVSMTCLMISVTSPLNAGKACLHSRQCKRLRMPPNLAKVTACSGSRVSRRHRRSIACKLFISSGSFNIGTRDLIRETIAIQSHISINIEKLLIPKFCFKIYDLQINDPITYSITDEV